MSELAEPVRQLLLWGVLPLWMAAGLADWHLHRRSDIGHTAGVRESLLHCLMFVLMGTAVLAVLLFEINAGVLMLALGLWLLHQTVMWMELRYVLGRRRVTALEQMIHGAMEWLPFVGLMLLAMLYLHRWWDVPEGASVEFEMRWRIPEEDPVMGCWAVWPVILAVALVNGLPLLEELMRTFSQSRRRA